MEKLLSGLGAGWEATVVGWGRVWGVGVGGGDGNMGLDLTSGSEKKGYKCLYISKQMLV